MPESEGDSDHTSGRAGRFEFILAVVEARLLGCICKPVN